MYNSNRQAFGQQSNGAFADPSNDSLNPQQMTSFDSTSPIFKTQQSPFPGETFDSTSHLFASDDSWAYGGYDQDDQGDPKRRRIARACDSCRRKKIKCDAKMPKCSHCENYKTECVFTHIEKKRAPPKGAKYIEGLENRLGRMEHLLRLSGLLSEEDDDGTDLGALEQRLAQQVNSRRNSPGTSTPPIADHKSRSTSQPGARKLSGSHRSQLTSPQSGRQSPLSQGQRELAQSSGGDGKENNKDVDDLADMMWCSLVTNNQGETRFIGSSSGFSIFSPKGIQWVNEKTGDNSFNEMIYRLSQDDNKWYPWREEVFGDIFRRHIYKPLPPQEECEDLINEYFDSFNRMFPLFHEPTFRHLVDMQYGPEPYDGSGWWASLNVALAISYRVRVLKNMLPMDYDAVSWAYFKNALGVLTELTMRNTDLLSVQALVGMCLFLEGTPNPQPSFHLIGSAIRAAHSIGLHKNGDGFGLNETEIEQRKRVFWLAYMIDKDICLRSGRPPAQDDDDWNVELPKEDPEDGFGVIPLADGTKTNLFHALCRYAIISAQVYNRLYTVKAARQSDGELLNTIGELDAELEAWKDSIPADFRPEHELSALPPQLVIHILILHFSYYNCLATIHRRSVHHGYWTSRLSEYAARGLNVKPLNPRVFSSAALCVSAARMSIHLIKYIPPQDYSFIWIIIYYPISSLLTLFANILQNPTDVRARNDLRLIGVVVQFLQRVTKEDTTGSLTKMSTVCAEFERIAGVVLDRAERQMSTGQKRKQEREREKLNKRPPQESEIPQPTRNSLEVKQGPDGFPSYRSPSSQGGQQQQQQQLHNRQSRQSQQFQGPPQNQLSQHRSSSDPTATNRPDPTNGASLFQPDFNAHPQNFGTTADSVPQQHQQDDFGSSNSMNFTDINMNTQSSYARSSHSNNANHPRSQMTNDILTSGFAANDPSGTSASSPDYSTSSYTPTTSSTTNNANNPSSNSISNAQQQAQNTNDIFNFGDSSAGGGYTFSQPMVPQELWNMPMTFEWDWSMGDGMGGFGSGGGGGGGGGGVGGGGFGNMGAGSGGGGGMTPGAFGMGNMGMGMGNMMGMNMMGFGGSMGGSGGQQGSAQGGGMGFDVGGFGGMGGQEQQQQQQQRQQGQRQDQGQGRARHGSGQGSGDDRVR